MATAATGVARLSVRQLAKALSSDGGFAPAFSARLAADLRRQCTRVERLLIKLGRDRVLHFLVCEGTLPDKGLKIATPPGSAQPADEARHGPQLIFADAVRDRLHHHVVVGARALAEGAQLSFQVLRMLAANARQRSAGAHRYRPIPEAAKEQACILLVPSSSPQSEVKK